MAPTWTRHSVQGTTFASPSSGALAVPLQRVRRQGPWARKVFRQFLAAVVNGSDHPCWQTTDATTQLALLPPREQNRLLDSGRVTPRRG